MKIMIILLILSLGSSNPHLTCEEHIEELNKRYDICHKIAYAEKSYKDQCFMDFYLDLCKQSGHELNMYMGLGGAYYNNDSIRKADFAGWKKGCGCK